MRRCNTQLDTMQAALMGLSHETHSENHHPTARQDIDHLARIAPYSEVPGSRTPAREPQSPTSPTVSTRRISSRVQFEFGGQNLEKLQRLDTEESQVSRMLHKSRSRSDSSSSSEGDDEKLKLKSHKDVARLQKSVQSMKSHDIKKILRLNDDMTKQQAKQGGDIHEYDKIAIFKRAVNKVIITNRFASNGGTKSSLRREPATIDGDSDAPSQLKRRQSFQNLSISAKERDKLEEVNVMSRGTELSKKVFKLNRRSALNGIARFFDEDETGASYDDFDAGINAMALLCGLVLGVPYQVLSSLDYSNLDWLKAELSLCPKDDWQYYHIYSGYRIAYTGTVYCSISGMVVATFYFLFKRNNIEDYLVWRRKARYMVIIQFIATAAAMISLILLTNLYFEFFLQHTEADVCNTGSAPYVSFGMGLAGMCFVVSAYLIF